jgi:fatty acid desaturase
MTKLKKEYIKILIVITIVFVIIALGAGKFWVIALPFWIIALIFLSQSYLKEKYN